MAIHWAAPDFQRAKPMLMAPEKSSTMFQGIIFSRSSTVKIRVIKKRRAATNIGIERSSPFKDGIAACNISDKRARATTIMTNISCLVNGPSCLLRSAAVSRRPGILFFSGLKITSINTQQRMTTSQPMGSR